MKNFGIAGSGRWAREIIKILHNTLDKRSSITIYSGNGTKDITEWLDDNSFMDRTVYLRPYNSIGQETIDAFIVANAAKDHFKITKKIINENIPVLVEKPLCLVYEETNHLIELASKKGVILGSSQIFLFSGYLNKLKKILKSNKSVSSISFCWKDPKNEIRYGQKKKFDHGVPIFKDLMPHILSILIFIIEGKKITFDSLFFEGGGGNLTIKIKIDNIPCNITIQRNCNQRIRSIEIAGEEIIELDFSKEPGLIKKGKIESNADQDWKKSESPATKMIQSFITTISQKKELDTRIKPNSEIYYLIMLIEKEYRRKQEDYFREILNNKVDKEEYFEYFMKEYILEMEDLDNNEIDTILKKIYKSISSKEHNYIEILNKDLAAFVRMHL